MAATIEISYPESLALSSLAEYRVSFLQPESDEELASDFNNA